MTIINWKSPAYIACELERPVKEVWTVIESLGLKPVAVLNGTAYFSTRAASEVEEVFFDAGVDDD